jgi:protein-L-isoaspartate(D-aspartate) O-methyltransferase
MQTRAAPPPDTEDARSYRAALVRLLPPIGDERVRHAMHDVPRHQFVPADVPLSVAYADGPLDIGHGQTASQPTVVAMMSEALEVRGPERVLEVGTGSGYQAAVLSLLAAKVYSIEVVAALAQEARDRLTRLGYANVQVRAGDGYAGWPDAAPFDRILLTAAPPEAPTALLDQLTDGGVLVAPVGADPQTQHLARYRKRGAQVVEEDLGGVRFVPMVGRS